MKRFLFLVAYAIWGRQTHHFELFCECKVMSLNSGGKFSMDAKKNHRK